LGGLQGSRLDARAVAIHVGGSPLFNLALEEAILEAAEREGAVFARIWVNSDSAVIGYTLKPCEEVRCHVAQLLGVPVVRRVSGGGAVFHDGGNINITLAVPERLGVAEGYRLITSLVALAVKAAGGRPRVENFNDVVVSGYKVSGSSLAIRSKATLAHATLLVNSSMRKMALLIKPRWERVEAGAVKPSKYMPGNLADILGVEPGEVAETVLEAIVEALGASKRAPPKPDREAWLRALEMCRSKYTAPRWAPIKGAWSSEPCATPREASLKEVSRHVAGGGRPLS
jgi:lipoate-protein ligase A